MITKRLWVLACLLAATILSAQEDSIVATDKFIDKLKISGYAEVYYNYNYNQPANHEQPAYLYSFNRHHEVNLNFGMIQLQYSDARVRGQLALMAGTYVKANMAAEPDGLKNIYEANVGVKLSKQHNLWLDAGVFASHIGFESAIGAQVATMTRSIQAENSPYFSTGVKVSYTSPSQEWFLSGLLLNGWQRIQRPNDNQTLAFGHQVTYKPSNRFSINSSSFIGSDAPDSLRQMRYFHNLYAEFKPTENWKVMAGFDIGVQQKEKVSKAYNAWYSPTIVTHYQIDPQWSVTLRGEYYADKKQVMVSTNTPDGFQTFGYSMNVDYRLTDHVLWRVEARNFQSKDAIFQRNQQSVKNEGFMGSTLAVTF